MRDDISGEAVFGDTNAFNEAVIGASFDLGEIIVSGQVAPDTYIVDKVSMDIPEKKIMPKCTGLWLEDGGDGGILRKILQQATGYRIGD